MNRNPYKYKGPLELAKDKLVLIPRTNELNKVIEGIKEGQYWAILGIRQIGKTTFLRQIENKFRNAYNVYINFQVSPKKEQNFYRWLMTQFMDQIPSEQEQVIKKEWKSYAPPFRFIQFLENFKPENSRRKVILLFDEIEGIPFLTNFLDVWRKIFQDRYHRKVLKRYSVIVAGAKNLVESTTEGSNAPFDIAETLYMKDFSVDESERLIDRPFQQLNIKIEKSAKKQLMAQISGHPQLLQYTCYNLVNTALSDRREIVEKDIGETINVLLKQNVTIDSLKEDLKGDKALENLIRDIFKGKKKKYHPYKEYSIKGAGCIVEDENSCCAFRNKVFERFLLDYLELPTKSESSTTHKKNNYIEKYLSERFNIIEEIGRGGMGIVYKATDVALDRTVAIKRISSNLTKDKKNIYPFSEEARANAKLSHQNIVRVYDVAQIKNDHLIVMEFIEGLNYKEIVTKHGPLGLSEIFFVAKHLFAALDFSHSKGIIHRDIKPQNIMKDRDSEIKVLDFGIAVIIGSGKNGKSGDIVGTPQYLSPEQIGKIKVDHRTDIYSAGATLFYVATGEVPFDGKNSTEILDKHLNERVPAIRDMRPEIPPELAEVIEKCLQKNRKDRYQSAKEALFEIEALEKKFDFSSSGVDDCTVEVGYETQRLS